MSFDIDEDGIYYINKIVRDESVSYFDITTRIEKIIEILLTKFKKMESLCLISRLKILEFKFYQSIIQNFMFVLNKKTILLLR